MIAIVDCKISNIRSVARAFEHIGQEAIVTSRQEDIEAAERIVLPGVGSFQQGMENLRRHNLVDILHREVVVGKKPLLGICLGMQLLAETGHENGPQAGLGFIKGECVRLAPPAATLKLPHMGWNDVAVCRDHPLLAGLSAAPCFYFCHSYHVVCPESDVLATCEYGANFTSVLVRGNIFAVQFHPEKSFDDGFQLLKNFSSQQQCL